jgi:hypothetical protein
MCFREHPRPTICNRSATFALDSGWFSEKTRLDRPFAHLMVTINFEARCPSRTEPLRNRNPSHRWAGMVW